MKDVRATKLMTRIVTDESVRANLSLRRVKLLLAMEKIGTRMFLKGVSPFTAPPLKKRGRMAVMKRATHQAIAENAMKATVGKKLIEGYISKS